MRITTELNVAVSEVRDELHELGAYSTEQQLDALRSMWRQEEADSLERDAIERVAWGVSQDQRNFHGTTAEQLMDARSTDAWREDYNGVALAADGNFLQADEKSDFLRKSDSEWLSWKVNQFIKRIAFRNKKGDLHLRTGRYAIRLYAIDTSTPGRATMSWQCYAPGCKFRACHSVVNGAGEVDQRRIQYRLGRILAHTYRH